MRVFLDANVIVSSILTPAGQSGAILDAWRAGMFELYTTAFVAEEVARTLARPTLAGR